LTLSFNSVIQKNFQLYGAESKDHFVCIPAVRVILTYFLTDYEQNRLVETAFYITPCLL